MKANKLLKKLKSEGYQGLLLTEDSFLYIEWNEGNPKATEIPAKIAHQFLPERIVIADNTPLSRIFDILKEDKVLTSVFKKDYADAFVKEYKKLSKKNIKKSSDPDKGPTSLSLYWTIEYSDGIDYQQKQVLKALENSDSKWIKSYIPEASISKGSIKLPKGFKKPKFKLNDKDYEKNGIIRAIHSVATNNISSPYVSGLTRPDFSGISIATKSHKHQIYKEGETIYWGVSMSFEEILPLPLILGNCTITEGILAHPPSSKDYRISEHKNPDFTLFSVISGILWELSFHGSPEDARKKNEELKKIVKGLSKNTDKKG